MKPTQAPKKDTIPGHQALIPAKLDDAMLPASLFRLFCHLTRRAGKKGPAWSAITTMAATCRLRNDTVRDGLKTLVEFGMITKKERSGDTTLYYINPDSAWCIPLPIEGRGSNKGGSPPKAGDAYPSRSGGYKGIPVEGAATAAPSTTEITNSKIPVEDIGAFPPARGAGFAPLSDQQWLSEQLSVTDLYAARKAAPQLATLDLYQVADLYHEFQLTKRAYIDKDVRKARKDRPDLTPWKWFAEQMGSPRDKRWRYLAARWDSVNAVPIQRESIEASRNASQPANLTPNTVGADWQLTLYNLTHGHPPEMIHMLYDTEVATLPWQTWDAMPAWMRAIFCGNYLAGATPEGITPPPRSGGRQPQGPTVTPTPAPHVLAARKAAQDADNKLLDEVRATAEVARLARKAKRKISDDDDD